MKSAFIVQVVFNTYLTSEVVSVAKTLQKADEAVVGGSEVIPMG